jgi:hypothetical protein
MALATKRRDHVAVHPIAGRPTPNRIDGQLEVVVMDAGLEMEAPPCSACS